MKNIKFPLIFILLCSIGFSSCSLFLNSSVKKIAKNTSIKSGDDYCLFDRTYSPEFIQKFKTSTLVYFYSKEDSLHPDQLAQLKMYVPKVWTITPVIFAPESDLSLYENNEQYTIFSNWEIKISGENMNGTQVRSTSHCKRMSYIFGTTKKGKPNVTYLMRYDLKEHGKAIKEYEHPLNSDYYYNYNPLSICSQLQILNNSLLIDGSRKDISTIINNPSLGQLLSRDTLFVNNFLALKAASLFNINYKKGDNTADNSDAFKVYPYKYKIDSTEELNKLFIEQGRGRFFADVVESFEKFESYFIIYDTKEGKVLYNQLRKGSNNDIKALVKKLD